MENKEELPSDDPRIEHHQLLVDQGYYLDRQFEGIAGLRVYRKIPEGSTNTVDVFKDGSWGKYGPNYEYEAGRGVAALSATFSEVAS